MAESTVNLWPYIGTDIPGGITAPRYPLGKGTLQRCWVISIAGPRKGTKGILAIYRLSAVKGCDTSHPSGRRDVGDGLQPATIGAEDRRHFTADGLLSVNFLGSFLSCASSSEDGAQRGRVSSGNAKLVDNDKPRASESP